MPLPYQPEKNSIRTQRQPGVRRREIIQTAFAFAVLRRDTSAVSARVEAVETAGVRLIRLLFVDVRHAFIGHGEGLAGDTAFGRAKVLPFHRKLQAFRRVSRGSFNPDVLIIAHGDGHHAGDLAVGGDGEGA